MNILTNTKLHLLVILLLTFLAYSNILQNQFISDDNGFISKWASKTTLKNIPKVFAGHGPPFREKVTYRPVRDTVYIIYNQIWGKNLFGYHLHSIVVLALTAVIIYLIILEITRKKITSFLASAIFAVHPIHTEAITFMTSSIDMTGVLFFFVSVYFFTKFRSFNNPKKIFKSKLFLISSLIFAILAFFSYELTLVLPLELFLMDFLLTKFVFKGSKFNFRIHLLFFLAVAFYLFIRIGVVGKYPVTTGYWIDNTQNLSYLMSPFIILKYLKLLILPFGLSFSHIIPPGFETFATFINDKNNFKGFTVLSPYFFMPLIFEISLLLAALIYIKKSPILSFGVFWFFISILPIANMISQPTVMSERYTYIGSFGACLIFALIISKLERKWALVISVLIILGFSGVTFLRNFDYKNEYTIWGSLIRVYPKSALGFSNLGHAYFEEKKYEEALAYYQKAINIYPNYYFARIDLALALKKLNREDEEVKELENLLQKNPRFSTGALRLAEAYFNKGDLDSSINVLNQATKLKYEETILDQREYAKFLSGIYAKLAIVYKAKNKLLLSFLNSQKSLELDKNNPDAQNTLKQLLKANPNLEKVPKDLLVDWVEYKTGILSFYYPSNWSLSKEDEATIVLKSPIGNSLIKLNTKKGLKVEPDSVLISKEYPKIENFDTAEVRVWQVKEGLHEVEFLLSQGQESINISVYPSVSQIQPFVDVILGTLKLQ